MSLQMHAAPFLAGGPLFRCYVAGEAEQDLNSSTATGSVRSLFDYAPSLPTGPPARAAAVDREYGGDRAGLAAALAAYNEQIGSPAAALRQIERLHDPRALVVVTGQQAGLLGGPMYTFYKAAGVVSLAAQLEAGLGRPVVPLFWAATEDHDRPEADHCWLLDRSEAWTRLRYPPGGGAPGLSVGAIPLAPGAVDRVLADLAAVLPGGRASGEVLAWAAATGRAADTLGGWFCRFLARVAGPLGLPILDPRQPAMRRLAAGGVRLILERNAAIDAALAAGAARVRALGFQPRLAAEPGGAQLFYHPTGPAGPRRALVRAASGDGFWTRDGQAGWTGDELREQLEIAPERFSGNVATRPLLQDTLLPTVAYVAGPGEVAYYAMLGDVYRAAGRTMPVIWPRPSYTLVEPAVRRLIGKRGLPAAPNLPDDLAAAGAAVVRAADEIDIDRLFGDVRAGVARLYGEAAPALGEFDPVLGDLAAKNQRRVLDNVAWLEKKAWQVARQRSATALGQLARLGTHLWPHDGPQERTAGLPHYLARGGPRLLAELAALAPARPFQHYFVDLR